MSETASEVSDLEGVKSGYSSSTSLSHHSSIGYYPYLPSASARLSPRSTSRVRHHPYSPLTQDSEDQPPMRNTNSSRLRRKRGDYQSLSQRYFRTKMQLQNHHSLDEQLLIGGKSEQRDASFEEPKTRPEHSKSSLHRRPSPLFLKHHPSPKQSYERRSSVSSRAESLDQPETGSRASQDFSVMSQSRNEAAISKLRPQPDVPKLIEELGRIRFKIQLRMATDTPLCTLQLKNFELFELRTAAFPASRLSIKMTVLPDYSEHRETLMGLVEEEGTANFEETVEWDNLKLDEDVVKLTVIVRGIPRRKVYGHAIFEMRHLHDPLFASSGPDSILNQGVDLIIYSSVSHQLDELYSDFLDLSLSYSVEEGKLTLGIIRAKLAAISAIGNQSSLYVKVTLFEGQTVIKAKKTRLVPLQSRGEEVTFYETFTILFPYDFLQEVSCLISLCGRTKQGHKFVIGRTSIGSGNQCSNQGLDHWVAMTSSTGQVVEKRHKLI